MGLFERDPIDRAVRQIEQRLPLRHRLSLRARRYRRRAIVLGQLGFTLLVEKALGALSAKDEASR